VGVVEDGHVRAPELDDPEVTLGEKQRLFTQLVARLIDFAYASGYELSFGETYRSDEQAEINALGPTGRSRLADYLGGLFPGLAAKIRNNPRITGARMSLHTERLAIDLNLFRNGVYLQDTDSYQRLGTFWKGLHPLARWGGDFIPTDGNHFSLEHGGVK
jgi:hypothetical protein